MQAFEEERLLPHSVEAEEAVLGSLLIDEDAVFEVAGFLKPDAFYRSQNRWIYDAILSLNERHEPVDYLTVTEELRRREQLEEVGARPMSSAWSMRYRRRSMRRAMPSWSRRRHCGGD